LLVVNITNTFLDLRPVVERAASGFGKLAILYRLVANDDDFLCFTSSWVLDSPDRARFVPGWRSAGAPARLSHVDR
jgi:hypothetical protein